MLLEGIGMLPSAPQPWSMAATELNDARTREMLPAITVRPPDTLRVVGEQTAATEGGHTAKV